MTIDWLELSVMQAGLGGLLAYVWGRYCLKEKSSSVPSIDGDKLMFVASIANTIGNTATNMAFSMIGSSSVQIVKSTEPIFTFILNLMLGKSAADANPLTLFSIFTICLGSSLFLREDVGYNVYRLIPAFVSNMAFSLRNVILKRKGKLRPLEKYTTLSLISFFITFPIAAYRRIGSEHRLYVNKSSSVSSIFHFMYNLASINVLQNVSPLTHAILNLCKRTIVVAVNIMHFSVSLSNKMLLGCIVLFFGLSLFIYAKSVKLHPLRGNLKAVVVLALLSAQTLYGYHHLTNRHLTKNEKREAPDYIFTVWLYDQPVPDHLLQNMQILALEYQTSVIEIYCGSTRCMKTCSNLKMENVIPTFFRLNNVINDTPFYDWMKRLLLFKFLSGKHFEQQLTIIAQLCILHRHGGLYIDSSHVLKNGFTFQEFTKKAWIGINDKHELLDIYYFPHHHIFPTGLSHEIMKKYPLDNFTNAWPVEVEFNTIQKSFYWSYKTLNLSNEHYIKEVKLSSVTKRNMTYKHVRNYAAIARGYRENGHVNLGDEIQAYSGIQLLPYLDTFIDREQLSLPKEYDVPTLMFFNAWWGEKSQTWPPGPNFIPQLISIHLQPSVRKRFSSSAYLKDHAPIGARDIPTLNWFRKQKISSFFSACFTLFLKNRYEEKDLTDDIYVVDINKNIYKSLPRHIRYKTVTHDYRVKKQRAHSVFTAAYRLLDIYSKAKLVITQRIHTALPCVAMGTPVVLINGRDMPGGGGTARGSSIRTEGFTEMFHTLDMYKNMTPKIFFDNFNWTSPPPNPRVDLLMIFRTRQWSYIRRNQEIYDSAIKFGVIPPSYPHLHLNKSSLINIHLLYDDDTDNKQLEMNHIRVIESILYHHAFSNLTIWSNSISQNMFDALTEVGFNVTVRRYHLGEMIKASKIELLENFILNANFSKCKHIPLIKMLTVFNNGGIFLENNILLTKALPELSHNKLENSQSIVFLRFDNGHNTVKKLIVDYVTKSNESCSDKIPGINIQTGNARVLIRRAMNNETCLDFDTNIFKFHGVEIDFPRLRKALEHNVTTFDTSCGKILNDYCLICTTQY